MQISTSCLTYAVTTCVARAHERDGVASTRRSRRSRRRRRPDRTDGRPSPSHRGTRSQDRKRTIAACSRRRRPAPVRTSRCPWRCRSGPGRRPPRPPPAHARPCSNIVARTRPPLAVRRRASPSGMTLPSSSFPAAPSTKGLVIAS